MLCLKAFNYLILLTMLFLSINTFALGTTNLVSWYKLDDTNTTTLDSFGANNGTNTNMQLGLAGRIGTDYNFNGTNSRVELTDTSFDFLTAHTNGNFTVSLWYKGRLSNAGQNILWAKEEAPGGFLSGTSLDFRANGVVYMSLYKDTANYRYYTSGNTNIGDNEWHHIVVTQTNGYTGIKLYLDGVELALTPTTVGTPATVNISTVASIGAKYYNSAWFTPTFGEIDEVSFFNTALNGTDVNVLYNSGNGVTYCKDLGTIQSNCFISDFNYLINKTTSKIQLYDITNPGTTIKNYWEWKSNGLIVSNNQDYNLTATELTDYNICLQVNADNNAYTSTTCKTVSTGEWTPPTTTFSSFQVPNSTDQNITLTCTDNNSGCKWTTYKIDSGDWNKVNNTGTLNFIYSGAGDHNIQYYSTDNSDNNETIKLSTFTTYGKLRFNTYDENTGLPLTGVTINNGTSDFNTGTTNYLDFNLQGVNVTDFTFTINKNGYSTRYYTTDLNQFTDLNISFVLLPDSIDSDIPFKVYQTNQTTIFANTFVEVKDKDTNYTIGRLKTDSTGNATFNLRADDSNYWTIVNNGQFTYTPVTVTILYPKDEESLNQIDGNWRIDITQNLFISYTELNQNKIIYLLPNTSLPYNIRIADMNNDYFARTYAKTYPGNPTTDTLQPYLVKTTTGLLTTITTKNAYTTSTIPNIGIKIYKNISGLGRTLVEQLLTDDKGQALSLLVLSSEYEFEAYQNETLLKIFNITASSSTIYIYLQLPTTQPDLNASGFTTKFIPTGTGLTKLNTGTLAFTPTIYNFGGIYTTYTATLIQNGVTLDSETYSGSDLNKTFTLNKLWVDVNKGNLQVRIVTSQGYVFTQTYVVNDSFGTNYNILTGLSTGLRQDCGCDTTEPYDICFTLLIIALLVSIGLVFYANILMGSFNGQASGLIFVLSLIFFSYLSWVPLELVIAVVLIALAFIVNERRS